jgi:hypothetical protein
MIPALFFLPLIVSPSPPYFLCKVFDNKGLGVDLVLGWC